MAIITQRSPEHLTNWRTGNRRQYRSTHLRVGSRHCPRALDYCQSDPLMFQDMFQVGIAAHACLEHAGLATRKAGRTLEADEQKAALDAICHELMSEGRPGDLGPVKPEDVFEGRRLAEAWLAQDPPTPTGIFELGLAFQKGWKLTKWDDPNFRFRIVLDDVQALEEEDEDGSRGALVLTDYKSAWPTNSGELDTLQMKAQAVAAWVAYRKEFEAGNIDMLRQRIVNLRTGNVFARELWWGDESDQQTINGFMAELDAAMDAYDAMADGDKPRPARPGGGCMGCPFILRCEEAQAFLDKMNIPSDPVEMARALCVAEATRDILRDLCKQAMEESGPVVLEGYEVGTHLSPQKSVPPENAVKMFEEYGATAGDFLTAIGGLSNTQAEKVARLLFRRDKAGQQEFLSRYVETKMGTRFGIKRIAEAEQGANVEGDEQ